MTGDLKTLLELFDNAYRIGELAERLGDGSVELAGLHGSSSSLFISALFMRIEKGIIVVTRSNRDAGELAGDLSHFIDNQFIYLFPSRETLPYDDSEPFSEFTAKRVLALSALASGRRGVFVLPVRTFTDYFMPLKQFLASWTELKRGDSIPFVELEKKLASMGYTREEKVFYPGSYAMRGDILDIFIYGHEHPFRIEFFGDAVESIRAFSPISQRSLSEVERATLLPARELVLSGEIIDRLRANEETGGREIAERISNSGFFRGIENYVSLLYDKPETVLEYAHDGYYWLFDSINECGKKASFFERETEKIYAEKKAGGFLLPPGEMSAPFLSLLERLGRCGNIAVLPERDVNIINFGISEKKGYRGQIKLFREDLGELLGRGFRVFVGSSYEGQTNRLRELLRDMLEKHQELKIATCDLQEGFSSERLKCALILDREIFNRKKRYKRLFLGAKSKPIEGVLDIEQGDYIVHIEHGIGIYRGIEKLRSGGVEKDFIKIEYRDGDEIFIPVDQINLLQRYIGHEGRIPRIDKLGTDTWKRVKEHVKRSVYNLAKELLEIYSARAAMPGHAFSKDTEWQYEFESGFRYEETEDQLRSVEEIKRDMESASPMDRLVCGDVGFGKTEVAIRAAFKAVMDGKQVAVLVPTTVLAEQHLNTFRDRFSFYPISVEMLSRFKTPREQKTIIENLKNGVIDVVVGTHRLIQKDVQFKDLGLVVIDEEQRFGVEHKEKLKQLRKLVDVITMTATPIPRTLYMAMTSIRDMSVIETPPLERVPIETYIMEHSEEVIVKAIRREVERGGQVYYVHNRVMSIDEKTTHLRSLMPDITFEAAHGQMDEQDLEEIMQAFYNQEFQVLVTTTIIESGLDIPNVNTIIIERADRFGLAQLYQLKGRVGRSRRKAYAYLMYPNGRALNEQAQKRLAVIGDHTELGAGFSIAMKDLEIRGAGNLLGREQHGDMLAVGFEMYVKLLDEAIRSLKGEQAEGLDFDPVLDLRYRGYIPESYIESERLRIELYKRLAGARSEQALKDLKEEIIDRFGKMPREILELFHVVELRVLCRNIGIRQLREKDGELLLVFEKSRVDILTLIQKINKNRRLFQIAPNDYNTLRVYRSFSDNVEKLGFLKDLFDYENHT